MKEVMCHRCDHIWTYRGSNAFVASCPKCKTSVTMALSDERLAMQRGEHRPPAPLNLGERRIVVNLRAV